MPRRRASTDSGRAGNAVARVKEWFLLEGNRGAVAGATAVALFAVVVSASVSGLAPLTRGQPLFYAFSGLIGGNLTLITVVVAINQLLLSRELGTPGELRSQIEGVVDYRRDIEATAGGVPPVQPHGFLRYLFGNVRREAQRLGGLTVTEASGDVYDEIDQVVTDVTDHADNVDELLQESGISTFDVLWVTLATNYANEIYHLRQVQSRHGDGLPHHVSDSIDELVALLQDVDIARQYFKTIYLQEELAALSRVLFYVGLPAVVVTVVGLFVFTTPGGASVPRPYLPAAISAILTVGLLPATVLFAYVLRVATVAERTVAIIPFTTATQEK